MGVCCTREQIRLEDELILPEMETLKNKISKNFRTNPFHNFGSRRQITIIEDFRNSKNKKITDFFIEMKIIPPLFIKLVAYTQIELLKSLQQFQDHECIFIEIIFFLLSNTKNNVEKRQEVINEIIKKSFIEGKNKIVVDFENFRKNLKTIIVITLTIINNFLFLPALESQKVINEIITDTNLKSSNLKKIVFGHLTSNFKQVLNFEHVCEVWEDHLLHPITFAGYSNVSNISRCNLQLKEEISLRFLDVFDSNKIINSFFTGKVE